MEGLRIRTPLAAQRAALHEDSCPDAGAVVEAEALDIKNQALGFFYSFF